MTIMKLNLFSFGFSLILLLIFASYVNAQSTCADPVLIEEISPQHGYVNDILTDGTYYFWSEYKWNSVDQILYGKDLGADFVPGTADDSNRFFIFSNAKEYRVDNGKMIIVDANNAIFACQLLIGGCIPDKNGNQSFQTLLSGTPLHQRSNFDLSNNIVVWRDWDFSVYPYERKLAVLDVSSGIVNYISPLRQGSVFHFPKVSGNVVGWVEQYVPTGQQPPYNYFRVHKISQNQTITIGGVRNQQPFIYGLESYPSGKVVALVGVVNTLYSYTFDSNTSAFDTFARNNNPYGDFVKNVVLNNASPISYYISEPVAQAPTKLASLELSTNTFSERYTFNSSPSINSRFAISNERLIFDSLNATTTADGLYFMDCS